MKVICFLSWTGRNLKINKKDFFVKSSFPQHKPLFLPLDVILFSINNKLWKINSAKKAKRDIDYNKTFEFW